MKIAILISGEPRFGVNTDSQFTKFENCQVDWFFYLWKNNPYGIDLGYVSPKWNNYNDDWAINEIRNRLPIGNNLIAFKSGNQSDYLVPQGIENCPNKNSDRIWSMYNAIYQADLLRRDYEKNSSPYDLVIRSRPDLDLNGKIDLLAIKQKLEEHSNRVFTPNTNQHGFEYKMNDMFAISSPKMMSIYCSAVIRLMEYHQTDNICFHPETLLAYHLHKNNIEITNFPFPLDVSIRNSSFGSWA